LCARSKGPPLLQEQGEPLSTAGGNFQISNESGEDEGKQTFSTWAPTKNRKTLTFIFPNTLENLNQFTMVFTSMGERSCVGLFRAAKAKSFNWAALCSSAFRRASHRLMKQ
jgi:hypothetical protein